MKVYIHPSERVSIKKRLAGLLISAVAEGQKELTLFSASKESQEIDRLLTVSKKVIRLPVHEKKTIYLFKGIIIELLPLDKEI